MIYRLKELKGDTIAVPQLVFSKLGIAEEYNVRVALYVLATGVTDPDKLCADLKLRSRISAESALAFWAGAGLLERYEENAAPGAEPSAPAPMRWAEIAAASRTDPMISSLIDCGQTSFARPLTHAEMEKLVNLYVQEGFAPETVMLCVAYVASRGKRTMAAVTHELKVWRAEGVETGEQADAHLKLLALRQSREEYVSSLLQITPEELTLGAGSRRTGRPQAGSVVLEQHPENMERQGSAQHPRCAWAGGCSRSKPEYPGGPRCTQRKRYPEKRHPPPFSYQETGVRSLYAYQKRIISAGIAHRSHAASDRPRPGAGCAGRSRGRHPRAAPR